MFLFIYQLPRFSPAFLPLIIHVVAVLFIELKGPLLPTALQFWCIFSSNSGTVASFDVLSREGEGAGCIVFFRGTTIHDAANLLSCFIFFGLTVATFHGFYEIAFSSNFEKLTQ